jgi:hypothetical protein
VQLPKNVSADEDMKSGEDRKDSKKGVKADKRKGKMT